MRVEDRDPQIPDAAFEDDVVVRETTLLHEGVQVVLSEVDPGAEAPDITKPLGPEWSERRHTRSE